MTSRLRNLCTTAVVVAAVACGGSAAVDESGNSNGGSGNSGTSNGGSGNSGTSNGGSGNSGAGSAGFASCNGPGQCVLRTPGCCGICSEPTLADVEPINQANDQAFYDATCGENDPICPACAEQPNPNLFAYCRAEQCVEDDITLSEYNQCNEASECVLRAGLGCCECGGFGVVALPASFVEQQLLQLVCPPDWGCDDCVPELPDGAEPACIDNRCAVVYTG